MREKNINFVRSLKVKHNISKKLCNYSKYHSIRRQHQTPWACLCACICHWGYCGGHRQEAL